MRLCHIQQGTALEPQMVAALAASAAVGWHSHIHRNACLPQLAPDATGFPTESMYSQCMLLEAMILLAQPPLKALGGGPQARTAVKRRSLCTECTRTGRLTISSSGLYKLVSHKWATSLLECANTLLTSVSGSIRSIEWTHVCLNASGPASGAGHGERLKSSACSS